MAAETAHEYERQAFLTEGQYDDAARFLAKNAIDLGQDDKDSVFFVLDQANLSIASTDKKTVIKFKDGQIGQGVGFEEYPEIQLCSRDDSDNAIRLLSRLTGLTPQHSTQIRRNYLIEAEEVEIALKYTETWGFHMELEHVFLADPANHTTIELKRHDAEARILRVAGRLGIEIANDEDLLAFRAEFERTGRPLGQYSTAVVREMYDSLYKRAAVGQLPEIQYMDQRTLDWITSRQPAELQDVKPEQFILSDYEKSVLASLDMPDEWFTDPLRKTCLHGQLHHLRVAAYAAHIARTNEVSERGTETVFLAGLLHDLRRLNDRGDPGHANRAGEWFLTNKQQIYEKLRQSGHPLKHADPKLVSEAISAHESKPQSVPPELNQIITILKAADALDRYSQPREKWWIRDDFLEQPPRLSLKALAFHLVTQTEQAQLTNVDIRAAIVNQVKAA